MVSHARAVMQGMLLVLAAACNEAPASATNVAHVYAGGGSTINVFRADLTTGALTLQAEVPAGDNAYLADTNAARTRLYLQTQVGLPVVIRAFDIQGDGALKQSADYPLPHPFVEGMTEVLLDPSGRWFLMSSTGGSSGLLDQLMPVAGDGTLGAPQTISSDFYGFAWDPSGRYLLGLDGVAILQYRFDAASGAITRNEPFQAEGSIGHQLLGLQPHPTGRWIFSVEENALGTFAFDAQQGTLVGQGYTANPVPGEAMTWSTLVVHPGGRFLYAVGSLNGSLVALVDLYAIDVTTGRLTFVRREKGGDLHQVRLGSLQSPLLLGDLLVIGGQAVAEGFRDLPVLCVYRIRPEDGVLAPLGDPVPLRPAGTANVSFILGKGGTLRQK
jgi:6-phosphogluconolactonase (cycloisomerase 2 family)